MAYIISCGIKEANHSYSQQEVQHFVEKVFPMSFLEKKRLMPIFENAAIDFRQFACPLDWFKHAHDLQEVNELYQETSLKYSEEAVQNCLTSNLLKERIEAAEIEHVIFVSSTGISTPTIDAYLIDRLGMNEYVKRTPIFGLGCAGGTSGVAKAFEWLKGNPASNVLVIAVELCSLTFQHNDRSVSNFVGAALFGDGASAVLLAGENSPLLRKASVSLPRVVEASTKTKPHSQSVMGWKVVNTGFEVIFKKSIPKLVRTFWKEHVDYCLTRSGWKIEDIPFVIAHPGGKKVLESYLECLDLNPAVLEHSRNVLKEHGNMSSSTVHFVLEKVLHENQPPGTRSLMTSLGPGFTSEVVHLEWM
ncbi:type III polyketide synthase [Halobacillus sp. Marseille-Q1614]|uniref:type III polyketide synthase n=1 Tax=Halobacillus sp. Marseille-Q1614 TaxID=2709134 RepID=UPI00156DB576|nr:3-oxoacyl-[acyl-carrier-protein] synthase III C-terminal domain-containing protein [Halobacillus sp. Marseille-Q1614]